MAKTTALLGFGHVLKTCLGERQMNSDCNACVTVAKGGVGESGASALLTHTVGGPTSKIIILRNVETSLCPNTWGVACLFVNGIPVASGNISVEGSSIQAEAAPGSNVAAVVHTVPNFNRISCVRLGELLVNLDECDLVTATGDNERQGGVVSCRNIATRDWFAWNNTMPPKPDVFHVVGEVQVSNPGVDVLLAPRNPQGINPKILLLDIHLHQRSGIWPQVVVWKQARYEKVNANYESVQIFYCNDVIANIPVDIIS
jgi:hypothetical protein